MTSTCSHFFRVGLAVLVAAGLAGCTAIPAALAPTATSAIGAPVAPTPPVSDAATASTAPGAVGGGDAFLPNSARTPGVTNPEVTQANIHQTICVTGWTATIRPPSNVTTALKVTQLASGYAYQGDTLTGHYEEDHLISLELGGAPSAAQNLWPEPYTSAEGARAKDKIENKLHSLVCAGAMPLADAQHAIATNWWSAYQTFVL